MITSNNKGKRHKIAILSFVLIGLICIAGVPSILFNFNSNPFQQESEDINTPDFTSDLSSAQLDSYENVGGSIDCSVQQSIYNTSTISFSNLDNSNAFIEPSPKVEGYESTFTNIKVENINAPNKTVILDDSKLDSLELSTKRAASFQVNTSKSILINGSFQLYSLNLDDYVEITVYLYNSSWDSDNDRSEPNTKAFTTLTSFTVDSPPTNEWFEVSLGNTILDNSKTRNNTWFIALWKTQAGAGTNEIKWNFGSDSPDNSEAYDIATDNTTTHRTIDYLTELDLAPLNNTPNPEYINMSINNIPVNGYEDINGSGYWESTKNYVQDLSGSINFEINSNWWDVSCDVTSVLINYTKSDITADSSFNIPESGETVEWTVAPSNFSYFDSRINHTQTINFTVPKSWNITTIEVFNDTDGPKDIIKTPMPDGIRVKVLDGGNGTDWYLTANSTNLLDSIVAYKDINSIPDYFNYSNTIKFNASFFSAVSNGEANLTVYSPLPPPQFENYTDIITHLATNYSFADWDVDQSPKEYGKFLVQCYWNNETDAGFIETNITIKGETELIVEQPTTNEFDSGDIFDLIVRFNDTGQNLNISDADLNYSINGGVYRPIDGELGDGLYNISVNCNDSEIVYGQNMIKINASKEYYNSAEIEFDFTVIAETELNVITYWPQLDPYNSTQSFEIEVFYNDTIKNTGIDDAFINYSLDGGETYRSDYKIDYRGGGYYNITVDCNDLDFNDYGTATIIVNASKAYHYNDSKSFDITIKGETDLTITPIEGTSFYSQQSFNISVYFNDTARDIGINQSSVFVYINDSLYTPYGGDGWWYDCNNGTYDILLNASDEAFYNLDINKYGEFEVLVSLNRTNYFNGTDTIPITITGNTTAEILSPPDKKHFVTDSVFNITFEYIDTLRGGISNATINYTIDGENYRFDNITYIGNGEYAIEIYVNDTDFSDQYGYRDILINISKPTFVEQQLNYTFHREVPTQITPDTDPPLFTVLRGLNISYTFNYSDTNNKFISGAEYDIINNSGGFEHYLYDYGNGNYTIYLNSSSVIAGEIYDFKFNISALGNETQIITLRINVTITRTNIIDLSWTETIPRHTGLNQTIYFYFNDTTNNAPITGLTSADINVYNSTGALWATGDFNWELVELQPGNYSLNVSLNGMDSGDYNLSIHVSKFPNYETSIVNIPFYLRGNISVINSLDMEFGNEPLTYDEENGYYVCTLGNNIDAILNITDANYGNESIEDYEAIFSIWYNNTSNGGSGTLVLDDDSYTIVLQRYELNIDTLLLDGVGIYDIRIEFELRNYENQTVSFDLKIEEGAAAPPGILLEDLLPFLLIIGAVGAVGIGAVSVYRGVIVPRKEKRQQTLKEVRTIFDDAINLEHLLVLYKGMGACIFFKSVGSEKIDPDLISGFISAVSSFGQEIESQKSLNEMKYGDKTLLLSDGEYVRVAIVLNKKASLPLRRNLKTFVERFEERYADALPDWAGQLKLFNDADDLVDDIFNTSIILPHQLSYQASDVKKLDNSFGKDVIKIAEGLLKQSGRDFFFIAKLLDRTKDKTDKDIAEIFMAIKELREKELFLPLDISELEEQAVTAEERRRIEQKVRDLSQLSEAEKQKTIEELLELNPGEREAYIASLEEQTEIVSAPIKSIVDETVIEDKKQAKKEIKKFEEKAEKERDIHNYQKAIDIYQEAGIIANDWDLKKKFLDLQENIRQTEIKKFEINMEEAISKAKGAEKRGEYKVASEHYKKASNMASEIFKLGVNKMNKHVKELTKKSKSLLEKSNN